MNDAMEKQKWEKGQSGNPKGRPKKEYCLTDILKEQGNVDIETPEGLKTRKQAISEKLWTMAQDGDITAIKYLMDRVDGKPLQQIENTNYNHDENDMSDYTDKELRQLKAIHKKHA